jgi:glycosyltransferase involved in cell wall biosynthesis
MEDIIPYVSGEFEIQFLRRTRGLWSKTFGILWQIAKSDGDIYHVNYALQDAYLVSKLKHLDILHIHGSDVRWTLHSKKWGWIVKHNLESAKVVLYSTPDLSEKVKELRPDAIYLPTPVRTHLFSPNNQLKAVYFKLSYEQLPLGLDLYLKSNNITLDMLEKNIPHKELPETLRKYDVFIDRFSIPSFSKTCLEAMSCGLATIDHRHHADKFSRVDELSLEKVKEEGRKNREFVEANHAVETVAQQLAGIWEESTCKTS